MKQVIFCRCSTDKQEVESQLQETKQYAISLGYSESDFIYISSVGASAVKLNELYLQTIQQLKTYILSGEVNAVICYHLNRLFRTEIVAMELKELLISSNVQLHIKEPTINLLNVDGTVNNGCELAFSLFATLNKQNAIELKAKTLRGKKFKAEKGLYIGGGLPIGFKVENDIVVIDNDKRYIVELVYQLYLEGFSFRKIATEIIDRRLLDSITQSGVNRILSNPIYCNGKYPPIITKELFDKVQQIIKSNTITRTQKHYFFCSRKIQCTCGYAYAYNSQTTLYNCFAKNTETKNSVHSPSILINVLDGLVFSLVKERVEKELKKNQEKNRKDLVIKIDSLLQKSLKYATDIEKFKSKYDKLNDMYINDFISKSDFEIKRKQLQIKENELKEKEYKNKLELDRLSNIFADKSEYSVFDSNNAIEVQRVIQQHIQQITISDIRELTITFIDGSTFTCFYNGKKSNSKLFKDCEFKQPLYFPTIEHHNDTFVLNENYNPIPKKRGRKTISTLPNLSQ